MENPNIDPSERRAVVTILLEQGPMSHEDLVKETGFDWKKTRKIIRDLRNEDQVSITLDRRYEAEDPESAAVA